MTLELKRRHERDESYNSSLSIFTFGPKTDSRNSFELSEREFKRDSMTVGSLVTLIERRPEFSSYVKTESDAHNSKLTEPLTLCNCKCLLL